MSLSKIQIDITRAIKWLKERLVMSNRGLLQNELSTPLFLVFMLTYLLGKRFDILPIYQHQGGRYNHIQNLPLQCYHKMAWSSEFLKKILILGTISLILAKIHKNHHLNSK